MERGLLKWPPLARKKQKTGRPCLALKMDSEKDSKKSKKDFQFGNEKDLDVSRLGLCLKILKRKPMSVEVAINVFTSLAH